LVFIISYNDRIYSSAIYISKNRDIRKLIKNDILKYNLLNQMGSKFIEDKTISYINHLRKSTKNELFIDHPELFLNIEDIKQYIKNVINEINKKNDNNNRIIKKNKNISS
jgi:hypothetical protein